MLLDFGQGAGDESGFRLSERLVHLAASQGRLDLLVHLLHAGIFGVDLRSKLDFRHRQLETSGF